MLAVSLLGNVAFAVYSLWPLSQLKMERPLVGMDAARIRESNGAARYASATAETNAFTRRLNWASLESENYKDYIRNLRDIECPEETIRDIILADINKLYDGKQREVGEKPKPFEYWKAESRSEQIAMISKKAELEAEKNEVLESLGIKPDYRTLSHRETHWNRGFSFLEENKKWAVLKLFADMEEKLQKGSESEDVDFEKLLKETDEAVKGLLTKEETFDYEMRLGRTANFMRFNLAGWDPDENEFLKVHDIRKGFDDEFNPYNTGEGNAERQKKRAIAQAEVKDQIKTALGEERYAAYERAHDWNYQEIHKTTKEAGLGTTEANQVFEMKRLVREQWERISNSPEMSQDERTAALLAIQQETERSLKEVVGGKGWEMLSEGDHLSWLEHLVPKEPAPVAE